MKHVKTINEFFKSKFSKKDVEEMCDDLMYSLTDIFDKYDITYCIDPWNSNLPDGTMYYNKTRSLYSTNMFSGDARIAEVYVNSGIVVQNIPDDIYYNLINDIEDEKESIEGRIGCSINIKTDIDDGTDSSGPIFPDNGAQIIIDIKWDTTFGKIRKLITSSPGLGPR